MIAEVIKQNLTDIQQRMQQACAVSKRDPTSVQLVAVTKYADWEWVTALAEQHRVFGENRPQQLAERKALLPQIQWHLTGQLQRNKARLAIETATLIHSVDSLRLLQKLASVGRQLNVQPQVLLQINVSEEASKSGFYTAELRSLWKDILECSSQVSICGLMTMAPASDDPQDARPFFRQLAALQHELSERSDTQNSAVTLSELSMGMSGDFTVAIEEGATLVRIGSRLFEGL